MIRPCIDADFETILHTINDGAEVYRGVIPPDRLPSPYMSAESLRHEIAARVEFFVDTEDGAVLGVMGIQSVQDVMLIRHAYVRTASQNRGVGGRLLAHLHSTTAKPVLMGAWADATWAIRFYQRHGFRVVGPQTKVRLLRTYWTVPERQVQTSVVLADATWWHNQPSASAQ